MANDPASVPPGGTTGNFPGDGGVTFWPQKVPVGMSVREENRAVQSTSCVPAGFNRTVVKPNEPWRSKVLTTPCPKWSKYRPYPARMELLPAPPKSLCQKPPSLCGE